MSKRESEKLGTNLCSVHALEKNFNPKWSTSVAGSIATTSHFYHSVGLEPLCTQSSNMAWMFAHKYFPTIQ